ncbi:uncharacterized protein EV420DRAFT_1755377, partial [Desarmillaria tabescens]
MTYVWGTTVRLSLYHRACAPKSMFAFWHSRISYTMTMSLSLANASHTGCLLCYVGPRNVTDRQQKSKQTTEDIIRSFVHQFDTTNLPSVSDPALEDLCMKEAEHRGYALDALRPYLVTGLNITASAYHHLDDVNVKVYIAFYTTFAIYFDDVYPDDPDALVGVPIFTKHFASSEKQPNKMLDDFANILAEASQLFGEVTAEFHRPGDPQRHEVYLSRSLAHQRRQTHKVEKYAVFLRELSGIAEAYAVFIFPTEMPYSVYIEALPLLREVICFINDVTSFKEELDSDNHNLISILAEARGEPKTKTLCNVAE